MADSSLKSNRFYTQDAYAIALAKRQPFAAYQHIVVTFEAAHTDVEIAHTLPVTNPDVVEVLAYNWELTAAPAAPPAVYRYIGVDSRPWTTELLTLRATAPGTCTLLLVVPT